MLRATDGSGSATTSPRNARGEAREPGVPRPAAVINIRTALERAFRLEQQPRQHAQRAASIRCLRPRAMAQPNPSPPPVPDFPPLGEPPLPSDGTQTQGVPLPSAAFFRTPEAV